MNAPPTDPLAAAPADRLLPWRQVKALAGLSRTTAWRLQNSGDFPRPVAISPGRVAWRESDVTAWTNRLAPRGSAPRPVKPPPASAPKPEPQPAAAPIAPQTATDPPSRSKPSRRRTAPAVLSNQMSFDF